MNWYTAKLKEVGIHSTQGTLVLSEALNLDNGRALETALSVCMSGTLAMHRMHSSYDSIGTDDYYAQRRKLVKAIQQDFLWKKVAFRLKQLQHEGI